MNSFFKALIFTSCIYIIGTYSYFIFFKNKSEKKQLNTNKELVTFNIIAREPKEKQILKQIQKVEKKPTLQKKVKVKKTLEKRSLKEVTIKKDSIVKKEKNKKEIETKQDIKIPSLATQKTVVAKIDVEDIKNNFFYELRQKLENNKIYPKNALSRNIEDSCNVSFKILANGDIKNINIDGKRVFKKSILNTINSCLPLNIPSQLKDFPLEVSFVLNYKIYN